MERTLSSGCSDGNVLGGTPTGILRENVHRSRSVRVSLEEQKYCILRVSRICFKLRVMILAVEMKHTDENGNTRMVVEVAPKNDCIIVCGTRAFMVCSSSDDAKR